MKSLEEFRMSVEADREYLSLYKKFKDIEVNAFNYKSEIQQLRQAILRYKDEGETHITNLIKENENLERILLDYMRQPGGRVYVPVWNSYKTFFSESAEIAKAFYRANSLYDEILVNADYALQMGYEKGWTPYVNQQIDDRFKELAEGIEQLRERLYAKKKTEAL